MTTQSPSLYRVECSGQLVLVEGRRPAGTRSLLEHWHDREARQSSWRRGSPIDRHPTKQ